jgi:uncharacterized ion transporter superfamily protein YfcC
MSFDPYGYQESTPPASGGPPGEPFPGSSGQVPGSSEVLDQRARQKVTLPAIFLIIIAVLNLLPGGYFVVNGIFVNTLSDEQMEKQLKAQNQLSKAQLDELQQKGYTISDIKRIAVYLCLGLGGAALVAALVMIVGGIRMLQMKSYGLAVFASVLAAVPCLSGLACCGMGEIVGIWSIVVLLQNDVRSAFR